MRVLLAAVLGALLAVGSVSGYVQLASGTAGAPAKAELYNYGTR